MLPRTCSRVGLPTIVSITVCFMLLAIRKHTMLGGSHGSEDAVASVIRCLVVVLLHCNSVGRFIVSPLKVVAATEWDQQTNVRCHSVPRASLLFLLT